MRRKYTVWIEGTVHVIDDGAPWDAFRHGYKFVLAAGGAVTDELGRLLVIRRLGKWDLPKGKVDEGEVIEAAALREVNEECGLTELRIVQPMPSTWHTYERKGKQHLKRTDWFLMRGSYKEVLVPQHEEDIEEVKWVGRDELGEIKADTYPALLEVFAAWESMVV
jgi:ADP-ribose pyrophosphatase YjhB (NUDIX family)